MEATKILIESYLDILEAEFFHDIQLMYEKHQKIHGEKFEDMMQTLNSSIEALRSDCKPGTSFLEAGLLMLSCNLAEESDESNAMLNELTKAAIEWKRRNQRSQLNNLLNQSRSN